jgi:tetratricopeptide (TPR) repeat protein
MQKKNHPQLILVVFGLLGLLLAGCSREAKKGRYLERADRYFASEQYAQAEIEYLNVVRLEPANRVAMRNLGFIYFEQGRFMQAFVCLRKAQELEPANVNIRVKLGSLYLSGRKLKEARDEAIQILTSEPGNDEAMMLLAETASTPKDIEETQQRLQSLREPSGNKPGFHLALGILSLRQKDLVGAGTAFRQALALNPKFSAAHLALGNFYWLQNDLKHAEEAFKNAADLAPLRSPRHLNYADFKIKTDDLETARRLLEELTKKVPDYVPAWNRLAEIAFAQKKYDDCDSLIKKTLGRDRVNFDALMLSGRLRLAQGDAGKAIAEFERVATVYPRIPQVYYHLALAELLHNDSAKASGSLNQAIRLDANFADAILVLAELNIRKGDWSTAIASLKQLIKERPEIVQAHILLANAYRARGNFDEASGVYRSLIEAFPKNPLGHLLIGLGFIQQTNSTDARAAFEKALELAPDYLPALVQLVELDLAGKQYAPAFQRVQRQIEKQPKAPEPQLLLAKCYLAQQDFTQAEAALLRTIELEPNSRTPYLLLARIYVDSNKHEQALARLQQIVAKNPKDQGALMQMGMIYDQIKNFSAARDTYEKILIINPRFSPALNNLAYLYSEHFGQLEKAYEMARKSRDLLAYDPYTADTLGWILYKRREYPWALSLLQESTAKLAAEPEVLFHLGMTHYMMGEEEPARISLQRALDLKKSFPGREEAESRLAVLLIDITVADSKIIADLETRLAQRPGDPIILAQLAAYFERTGAVEKARNAYQRALKENPKNVRVTIKLARLYSERLHNSGKALELAKSARSLAPEDASISSTLGRLAYESGDYKWALSLLQESSQKLPDQPNVLYDLAFAYYSIGRVSEAEAAMTSALQTKAGFTRVEAANRFLTLTALYSNPEEAQLASSQVQEILRAEPAYLPAQMVQGRIQEQQGNARAAKQIYETALGSFPFFTPANQRLAILYVDHFGDSRRAYEHALKAREAFPDDPETAKVLGKIIYRLEDYGRSAQLLKESLRKRTNDGELFFYLGMAHYHLKQKDESKRALAQALALNGSASFATEAKSTLVKLQ